MASEAGSTKDFSKFGYTLESIEMCQKHRVRRDATPWPKKTFIIRNRDDGRAITLINGRVRLMGMTGHVGCCLWRCDETGIHFAFRSIVSGGFLGCDVYEDVCVAAHIPTTSEQFAAWKHPDGGWELLLMAKNRKVKLGIEKGSQKVVLVEEGETTWEFCEVVEN